MWPPQTNLVDDLSGEASVVARLVRHAAAGDAAAWAGLVDRYAALAWSVISCYGLRADEAAEASQQAWIRMAQGLRTLEDPALFGRRLVAAARNECSKIIDRRDTRPTSVPARPGQRGYSPPSIDIVCPVM
jgi:DNA-directed RNA polymerase specialized sigma24 family protein